ncbi:helix-turn-helix domain-containing protein [Aquaspirillum serpens]|uniref:helix-turn-helix domain-containing protein n=1 Tax=Aquaspirillum serpens TaxID=190 RepID=UPI0003B7B209|nr:helix-turn-helix transcriptional regulator [Aquaspirillum serpens]
MRYAKKSPEALQILRQTLVARLAQSQPTVAEAARWIRESLGLNQREFAKLVGLSTPQIARLERGEANPTLETLMAIGKPYGLYVGFIHPTMCVQSTDHTASPIQATPQRRILPRLNFNKTTHD